jgi:hypothetical protein
MTNSSTLLMEKSECREKYLLNGLNVATRAVPPYSHDWVCTAAKALECYDLNGERCSVGQ